MRIDINIAYVVNNTGSNFYSKYVIPLYKQSDGAYMCRFTGTDADAPTVTFEEKDLITIKEWKFNEKKAAAERKVD